MGKSSQNQFTPEPQPSKMITGAAQRGPCILQPRLLSHLRPGPPGTDPLRSTISRPHPKPLEHPGGWEQERVFLRHPPGDLKMSVCLLAKGLGEGVKA